MSSLLYHLLGLDPISCSFPIIKQISNAEVFAFLPVCHIQRWGMNINISHFPLKDIQDTLLTATSLLLRSKMHFTEWNIPKDDRAKRLVTYLKALSTCSSIVYNVILFPFPFFFVFCLFSGCCYLSCYSVHPILIQLP